MINQLPPDFSPETGLARKNEEPEKPIIELTLENRRLRVLTST